MNYQIPHQPIPQPQNTLQQNACTRIICTSKTQTANIKGFKEVTTGKQISSVNSFNASVTNRGDCLLEEAMNSQIRHQPIPQPQNTLQQNACTRIICTSKTQTANIKGFKEVTTGKQISSVNSFNASVTNRGDCLLEEAMNSQIRHQPIPQPQNTLQQNACTRSICTGKTQTANIKEFKEVTIDKQISSVNSFNVSVTNRGDCLREETMNAEKQKRNEQRIANSTDKTNSKLTINPEDKDTANNHLSSYSVDELPSLPTDIRHNEQLNDESRPPNQKDQKCISQRPNVQRPGSSLRTVSGIAHTKRVRRLRKWRKEQMELEELMLWALL
ncbi:unnamed protein product [Parnassius mnemosyne]|uniref:Uncharacterized protein n=1 Tax=Parnassius mnemosyne TaxID=213953 RepID=A0AAV1KWU0_9NEOP